MLASVAAVRLLRQAWAARSEARCRELGRATCSLHEFVARCRAAGKGDAAAAQLLGAPAQELCGPGGCTRRFVYDGPWTPDNASAPGGMLCSLVSDARGTALRAALAQRLTDASR